MEYRIEQLARTAGVAVDTIRFYQGKGLLDAPRREGRVTWYGDGHLERLGRIRDLQQRGFTLTVIQRFLAGELEPSDESLVAAVTRPTSPQTLTLAELADRSGVAAPLLKSLENAGLLVPVETGDEALYPAEDLEAIAAGMRLIAAGVPLSELMDLAKDYSAAVDRTARQAVELFDHHVRERIHSEGGEPEAAERNLLELFNQLLDASGTLVRHHFQRTVLRAARDHIEKTSR
ncbi:MAG TPA: MerR family transcriptional regulator [Candidatus Dormibacteraeota bacterium]|jgi:DNA-binding transcriptional MerR regulator